MIVQRKREPHLMPLSYRFCINAASWVSHEGIVFTNNLFAYEERDAILMGCEQLANLFFGKGCIGILQRETYEVTVNSDGQR